MNPKQAYEMLQQIQTLNVKREAINITHSTFLVVEFSETGDDRLNIVSSIIDPEMPDSGGATEYLALESTRRIALELAEIINIIAPGVSSVAIHAPFSSELCEKTQNSKPAMCSALRHLSQAAAIRLLEDQA